VRAAIQNASVGCSLLIRPSHGPKTPKDAAAMLRAAHGRHGFLIQPFNELNNANPAAMAGFLF